MQFRTDRTRNEEPTVAAKGRSNDLHFAQVGPVKRASTAESKQRKNKPGRDFSAKTEELSFDGLNSNLKFSTAKSVTREVAKEAEVVEVEKLEQYSEVNLVSASNDHKGFSFSIPKARFSSVVVLNVIAVLGLVYAIATIYSINERSKLAQTERTQASVLAQQAEYDVAVEAEQEAAASTSLVPVKINIPAIDVDATIEEMGVTEDNHIEAPDSNYVAGWFNQSSVINEGGATIIDGHLGSNIAPGIFWNLESLEVGDNIVLHAENGEEAIFIVRETEVVDRNAKNFDKYYSSIGVGNGLNIITCSGGYLQGEQTYDSRLIVYAEQVYS